MIPYNNCDKLKIAKLLIIMKILEESNCNEDINIRFKKSSKNIKHKDNVIPNNLCIKKNMKDRTYTECILPMQEVTIKVKDDLKCILPIQDVPFNDVSEFILPINEVKIEEDPKCINKDDKIINTTVKGIYEPSENISANHNELFISTIPIIIAEKNIDIPIESTFKLKNAALDIKSMKKELYLTNSTLIPMYENHSISPSLCGKLFLEGIVRNKLDFSIAKVAQDNVISLDTESVIIYIPFKCTTLIQYKTTPVFSKENTLDYIPLYISSDCVDINKDCIEFLSKKNADCMEYINCNTPPITCEINEYRICETYTLLDKTPFNKDFPIEINFQTIKENIIINLSLSLLQEQDVTVNYTPL